MAILLVEIQEPYLSRGWVWLTRWVQSWVLSDPDNGFFCWKSNLPTIVLLQTKSTLTPPLSAASSKRDCKYQWPSLKKRSEWISKVLCNFQRIVNEDEFFSVIKFNRSHPGSWSKPYIPEHVNLMTLDNTPSVHSFVLRSNSPYSSPSDKALGFIGYSYKETNENTTQA